MSPTASRVLLRLGLIFGVILLGGVLMWGLAGVGPSSIVPEREAELLAEEQLATQLQTRGFQVLELERDGGLYVAEVESAAGRQRLHLDAQTGAIIGMPQMTGPALPLDQLRRLLRAEGYREIGPITWERGSYQTVATGPEGIRYDLELETYSGTILERKPR
ncbi:hypothetical protein [Algihabitans albus]|uniref:hypothetical protein n=1 Tax=Algihabitans albus TaxID=2164067 RepID=UPI0013C30686|nr:hypothetical protein [Algihabitans albus]